MPKIITSIEPTDTSSGVENPTPEGLAAVAANAAGAPATAAEVIRDSSGKLVQVNVNLPDTVDNNGLETAANAINNNNGVAKAMSSRKGISGGVFGAENSDGVSIGNLNFAMGDLVEGSGLLDICDRYADVGSRAMRVRTETNPDKLLAIATGAGRIGNEGYFDLVGDLATASYDALKVSMRIFNEAAQPVPVVIGGSWLIDQQAPFTSHEDWTFREKDDLDIKMGKIHFKMELATEGLAAGVANAYKLTGSIGSGAVHEFTTVSVDTSEWFTLEAEYDGLSGTGSMTVITAGGTEVFSWTGLSGLVISSRSNQEFNVKTVHYANLGAMATRHIGTGGVNDGVEMEKSVYLDQVSLEITNLLGA